MDAERFGRALGIGVRVTGKALKSAVDAAAAPNPRPYQAPAVKPSAGQPDRSVSRSVARSAAQTITQGKTTAAGIRRGGKRFGEAVWEPAARAGGVLWFEVTGSFFALFALAAGFEAWRRRTAFYASASAHEPRDKAWFALAMFAIFAWFTVSSFLKARRRARR